MTVEELIEELKRQPNPRVPVAVRVTTRSGPEAGEATDVRFEGARVVVEAN